MMDFIGEGDNFFAMRATCLEVGDMSGSSDFAGV
jgi:hypothetical protein